MAVEVGVVDVVSVGGGVCFGGSTAVCGDRGVVAGSCCVTKCF